MESQQEIEVGGAGVGSRLRGSWKHGKEKMSPKITKSQKDFKKSF